MIGAVSIGAGAGAGGGLAKGDAAGGREVPVWGAEDVGGGRVWAGLRDA